MSASASQIAELERPPGPPVLDLGPGPSTPQEWLRSMWAHRGVTWVLARKDFQARYKRAALGVLWAVAVPLLQAAALILIFSHFVHPGNGVSYGAFVISGILPWSYFASTLPTGATAIVEGAGLTDKVWFPRAILPLVPCLSALVGLGIAIVLMLIAVALLGASFAARDLLLIPACALMVAFTVALTSVLAALQVYFRDVRFIVTAALTVWFYATPIMYPQSAVGSLSRWLDFNPMTGIINLFHKAVLGGGSSLLRALAISVGVTLALGAAAVETHRRHDRLFVDLL
jgi:lipopolysaccharide transport system permease protein